MVIDKAIGIDMRGFRLEGEREEEARKFLKDSSFSGPDM